MDSLTSVLQSPAVQELLPTALGAAGGFLTTPRRAGLGGAIGGGLLGAAQGLTTGQEAMARTTEAQQMAQHYALVNQQAQQAIKDRKTDQPTLAGLVKSYQDGPLGDALYGKGQPRPDLSQASPDTLMQVYKEDTAAFDSLMKGEKPNLHYIQGDLKGQPYWFQVAQSAAGGPPQTTPIAPVYQDPNKQALTKAEIDRANAQTGSATAATDLSRTRNQQLQQTGGVKPETPAQTQSHRMAIEKQANSEASKDYDELVKTYWIKSKAPDRDTWIKQRQEEIGKNLEWKSGSVELPPSIDNPQAAVDYLKKNYGVSEMDAINYLKSH